MGYRLLLISHDKDRQELWASCVAAIAATAASAGTGAAALKTALEQRFDLALLDLELPDMPGLDWLRIARQTAECQQLPVIALSPRKTDELLAEAFDWGADDFVELPCDAAELAARMRAVLRRRFERQESAGGPLVIGCFELDPGRHECRVRGKSVPLRPREFELLDILMRKAGRVLSRQFLLETIWGMSRFADTRSVDVAVSRLRKALGRRAGNWIETVERFGYRFRLPEKM